MSYVIAYQEDTISLYNNNILIEEQSLLFKSNENINHLIAIIQACYLALKNNTLVFSMVGWKEDSSEYIEKLFGKSFSFKFKYANEKPSFWLEKAHNIITKLQPIICNSQSTISQTLNNIVKTIENNIIFLFAGIQKVFIKNNNAICIDCIKNPLSIGQYDSSENINNYLGKYNLFTDASVRPQEKIATIACTLFDQNNVPIVSSRSMIDYEIYNDSNNAEIYSIAQGLRLINSMNIKEVNIFTDSSCAIEKLQNYSPYCLGLFKESVQLVIEQARILDKCIMTHIPRELNALTDSLTHFN